MSNMKKALLGLIMFMMLTPVLVCTMTFCPMQSAQAAEPKPCHETEEKGSTSLMLVLDCMGVDLFQQDTSLDFQPNLIMTDVSHTWFDLAVDYNFLPKNVNNIRGPPDKYIEPRGQPSIILTTQRLRI